MPSLTEPSVAVNLSGLPTSQFKEGTPAVALIPSTSAITLSSGDSAAFSSATVAISKGFTSGDLLSVTTTGTALTASYDAATGKLVLVGQANAATYTQVLATLKFSNTTISPTALRDQRDISLSVRTSGDGSEGVKDSAAFVIPVSVVGVNSSAPVLNATALNPSTKVAVGTPAPTNGFIPSAAIKVSNLVRTGTGGNVVDADGDRVGIALTAVDPKLQAWFSTDNGAIWKQATGVSTTKAVLLHADENT